MRCSAPCLLVLIFLTGCIGDQKGRQEASPTVTTPLATRAEPVPEAGVPKAIKDEIITSANSTQNQMSGLLNLAVSKIAEKMTGIEANFKELLHASFDMANTAVANLKAEVNAQATLNATLKAQLDAQVQINNKMEASFKAELKDLKVQLDNQVNANASAQMGLSNKFEQKLEAATNTAGRDVNYLPKEVVQIIRDDNHVFAYVISTVCGIISLIITLVMRAAAKRATEHAEEDREERQDNMTLLLKVLAMLPEQQTHAAHDCIDQMKHSQHPSS